MAIEAVDGVVFVIVGLAIGLAAMYLLLRNRFAAWKANYELEHKKRFDQELERAAGKKLDGSRNALRGQIAEKLAPLTPEFLSKYDPSDARFLGMPVDYVIFKNLSKSMEGKNELVEIVFVEVKTGKSSLDSRQTAVKNAVENLRVKFETLRLAENGE